MIFNFYIFLAHFFNWISNFLLRIINKSDKLTGHFIDKAQKNLNKEKEKFNNISKNNS